MCKKVGNTCKQLPLTAGYWFFKKLHGSIEDKFSCRYFGGRVKNKNQTIWVYSKKFAFQILNFFKMSISEPVFSLQTHIHLFIRYLQQIQYLTTRFFCIDPKHKTPTADILEYIVPCYTFRFSQFGYLQQNKLLIPINFPQPGYQQQNKLIIPLNFPQPGYQQQKQAYHTLKLSKLLPVSRTVSSFYAQF